MHITQQQKTNQITKRAKELDIFQEKTSKWPTGT